MIQFWNQAYEIIDGRKEKDTTAPIGIAVPAREKLELWTSDGRAVSLDVDDDNYEEGKPATSMTIYTDDGMLTLLPLRLDNFYENVAPFLDLEGTTFHSDEELNDHYAAICREA